MTGAWWWWWWWRRWRSEETIGTQMCGCCLLWWTCLFVPQKRKHERREGLRSVVLNVMKGWWRSVLLALEMFEGDSDAPPTDTLSHHVLPSTLCVCVCDVPDLNVSKVRIWLFLTVFSSLSFWLDDVTMWCARLRWHIYEAWTDFYLWAAEGSRVYAQVRQLLVSFSFSSHTHTVL